MSFIQDSVLVSIITPAWRAAPFIGETIRSAQAQDYTHWEMLIVDDCSPDDTCARVAEIAAVDSRVRLIRQEKNAGPAAARAVALQAARGRYVAFLDSDDLWLPGKLSLQLAFMRETGAALTYTQFRRITQDAAATGRLIDVPLSLNYAQLLCNTAIVTSTVLIDRSQTGFFSMPDAPYDDYALWLNLTRAGHVAYGLRRDLLRYRVVANSVSRSKRVSALRVWKMYREFESLGLLRASWSFANYAARGWLKYRLF